MSLFLYYIQDQPYSILGSDIVLPRSKIPFWLTNKSSGSSARIELYPFINYNNWMGLILGVCFSGKYPSDHFYCSMKYLNKNWEVGTVRCPSNSKISSNHIWLFYLLNFVLVLLLLHVLHFMVC